MVVVWASDSLTGRSHSSHCRLLLLASSRPRRWGGVSYAPLWAFHSRRRVFQPPMCRLASFVCVFSCCLLCNELTYPTFRCIGSTCRERRLSRKWYRSWSSISPVAHHCLFALLYPPRSTSRQWYVLSFSSLLVLSSNVHMSHGWPDRQSTNPQSVDLIGLSRVSILFFFSSTQIIKVDLLQTV